MTTTPAPTSAQRESWASYLDPDETLLWEGAPATGIRVKGENIAKSAFGIFFLGFALFWMYMAGTMGGPNDPFGSLFSLFGLPFVAVGAYLVFGQYFWEAYARGKTRYGLSNKRAFIAKQTFGRQLRSFALGEDTDLDYRPGPEGSIYFKEEVSYGGKHGRTRHVTKYGFEYIADSDAVYRLMREVKQGRHNGPGA